MPREATERSPAASLMGDAAFHDERKPPAKLGAVLPSLTVPAALVVTAVLAITPPASSRRRAGIAQFLPSAEQMEVILTLSVVTAAEAGRPAMMAFLRIICSVAATRRTWRGPRWRQR